ncbi:uncharacterized protein LOC102806273 [Saccoglossus kowalevskii]|uniref:Uncharacterized protein LOC102806273 n=1 Tax=Saccoglossus kowalevskii TaxID=10224 RepID=A0ABM0M0X9_SACKO|nr:PREDICTED: uncharacterized protein LOC102806273 [Saccoglossus kowalevskii]
MPINRAAILQFSVLVLALPAQYLISNWTSTSSTQRSQDVRDLALGIQSWTTRIFTLKTWKNLCSWMVAKIQSGEFYSDEEDDMGESPAIEVLKYREKDGHFAGSPEPRSPRPAHVKYRVGQVIRHKKWGYRGVITGWDLTAKAPEEWLKQMHPKDKPYWRNHPNYAILVDTRDRAVPQLTYIPEENIEIITNTKIIHPEIENYFEGFDGSQFLARPWLKVIYPHDQ